MRRGSPLLLALVLVLSLAGCFGRQGGDDAQCTVRAAEGQQAVAINHDPAGSIRNMLSEGTWTEGTTDCLSDYVLTVDGQAYAYHSECGTYNDLANRKSLVLSPEDREFTNSVFAAYITPDEQE